MLYVLNQTLKQLWGKKRKKKKKGLYTYIKFDK